MTHRHLIRISFERCAVCFDSHICDQFCETVTLVMWCCTISLSLRAVCNLSPSSSVRALLSRLIERYTFSCKRVQQVGGSEQLSVSEHHSELTKRLASLHRSNFHADLSQLQEESEQLAHVFMRHICMKDSKRCHSPLVSSSACSAETSCCYHMRPFALVIL